jgi:glycosyltransferase involved in cell wall biosynthesis
VDVVDEGRSGLLVAPGRVDELAAGMASLARDAAAREGMGKHARAVAVDRYDERDATRRYLSLFQEVGARC